MASTHIHVCGMMISIGIQMGRHKMRAFSKKELCANYQHSRYNFRLLDKWNTINFVSSQSYRVTGANRV